MANLRDIRKRIDGVKNTKQLTRAMKMVAAAKLRRAQDRVEGSRAYMRGLETMLGQASAANPESALSPLQGDREVCLVFASDRGLCGAYNSTVQKRAVAYAQENPDVVFVPFGRKMISFCKKANLPVLMTFEEFYVGFDWVKLDGYAQSLFAKLNEIGAGKLSAVYTRFVSAGVQRLAEKTLLPIDLSDDRADASNAGQQNAIQDLIVEPTKNVVLDRLVQQYARFSFYYVAAEVIASEHGARMTAMDAASKNASEMIDKLRLALNRARQASITKELSEIIGGAEALNG